MNSIKKRKIACFDLDLTLLDHKTEEITQSALRAIDRLRKEYYIVLASGRNMELPTMKKYLQLICPDAIIHANGAKVTLNDKVLADYSFSTEQVKDVIKVSREKDWCIGAYLGDFAYFVNKKKAIEMYTKWWGKCDRKFEPVEQLLSKKLYTMLTNETTENMTAFEKEFPDLHLMRFGGMDGADIVRKEASKRHGMEHLLEQWNLGFSDVVAFGDSQNDLALIEAAGIGVAMGNGDSIVRQSADYVTDQIDKDGVWKACEALGLF